MKTVLIILLKFLIICECVGDETATNYWNKDAVRNILARISNVDSTQLGKAENVIIFIGDGMGVATTTAARIFKGQKNGRDGCSEKLIWDNFPTVAHVKTFTANTQIGESAACATAIFSGTKANSDTLGVDARTLFNAGCKQFTNPSLPTSIFTWAQNQGKRTGFVTTTRVTHATPAALYAHSSSRYWEDDSKIPEEHRTVCKDIARQLIEDAPGRYINVILGGGQRHFKSNSSGRRLDGKDLIHDWLNKKKKRSENARYVRNRADLSSVSNDTDFLLGLFAYSHMDFNTDRDTSSKGQPSLAEMTSSALKILSKGNKGFLLMVESGRIDHGHHYNNAYRAIDETLSLEEAVSTVMNSKEIDLKKTLIIVTCDHSDAMTFSGYAIPRNNPIFGVDTNTTDVDFEPYSVLSYSAGPGYTDSRKGNHPKNTIQVAAIPKVWGNHGGCDVPLYAIGPSALHLFTGTIDQSYIPHAIAFTACLGDFQVFQDRCILKESLIVDDFRNDSLVKKYRRRNDSIFGGGVQIRFKSLLLSFNLFYLINYILTF